MRSLKIQKKYFYTACQGLALGLTLGFTPCVQTYAVSPNTIKAVAPDEKSNKIIGIITDSSTGEPLVGATIKVLGTSRGVSTDVDGRFEITVPKGQTLEVSYVGYVTKKIKIGNTKLLSITLSDNVQTLQGAVITAFGTAQKKETVTGSIQTVRPSDLKVPSTNLSTAFAGRLSGVISYQRSGEPGHNGADFYIRGIATISGATSPLIIMDGVEISGGDLNNIDPEIIESFSILKDATATAMYGTRGANGVLIIKTKTGADLDRPIIGIRVENWVNTPIQVPKTVNGVDYMRLYNEASTNQGLTTGLYTDDKIQGTIERRNPYIYPDVDWYKELFKNATWSQRANFNVRGGTSKVTYFMNMNVSHETSMLKNVSSRYFSYDNTTSLMKYAFQNNVDYKLSKSAKLALHLNVQLSNMHGQVSDLNVNNGTSNSLGDVFNKIMNTNPVDAPIMYPAQANDNWYRWGSKKYGSTSIVNPVAEAAQGYRDAFTSTVVANVSYEQKLDIITKGLSFHALASFKNYASTQYFRMQEYNTYQLTNYTANPSAAGGYDMVVESLDNNPSKRTLNFNKISGGNRRYYLQAHIDYNRKFGDHNISAMTLFNIDEYNNNESGTFLNSLPKRRMGLAGRASYDYKYRYLVEFNAGYNGSESFAKGHRWGFFPSVAVGWNISQENFFKPLTNYIQQLKLRGSYGLVGNDNVGGTRFAYQPIVTLSGDPGYTTGYGTITQTLKGPNFNRYENTELTWEVGHKLNVGVDLRLFNALNLTIDIFRENRDNIFQARQSIPYYFGTSSTTIYANSASVVNKGLDMAIDFGKQITKDLAIEFKGTFTYAHNVITKYDEPIGTKPVLKQVGRSLNQIYGYEADGYFKSQEEINNSPRISLGGLATSVGDIKYKDQPDASGNYDGIISSDDQVRLGYPTVPEIVYGFGPSMSYKKWDLSFFFQGQARVSLMMRGFAPFGTQNNRNVLQWIADSHWSQENPDPNALYPRLTRYDNPNNTANSSHWLRSAAFLRLKTLEVGYKFKFGRIYASATNIFRISPFRLWDPEKGGGAGMSYPLQRTFNLGLQLTFK